MAKYLDKAGTAYLVNKILDLLKDKVDIEEGKTLSEEDFTSSLKEKLDNLENYSLPIANGEILGGIKIGEGLTINLETGVLSATGEGSGSSSNIEAISNEEIDEIFS